MKKFYLPLIVLSLFALGSLHAQQVTLKTPNMEVEPNATIHLDLLVEDFEMITGVQFSLNWDPNVLEFVGVDNFGLPGMSTEGNFGTLEADQGKLRFIWYQQEVTGVTLPDMSAIFSLWFKVTGTPNSKTEVMISDQPIVIEVVGVSGMLPYDVENGTVTVMNPNASTEVRSTDFILFQNSPNPFTDVTQVRFDLQTNTQTLISIYDQHGREVFSQKGYYTTGSHNITLYREQFGSAGTYLLVLKTSNGSAAMHLIVQ